MLKIALDKTKNILKFLFPTNSDLFIPIKQKIILDLDSLMPHIKHITKK